MAGQWARVDPRRLEKAARDVIGGASTKAIAASLGMSESAVRSAARKLRRAMARDEGEGSPNDE